MCMLYVSEQLVFVKQWLLIKRKLKSPNATADKISFLNVKNKLFFYKWEDFWKSLNLRYA